DPPRPCARAPGPRGPGSAAGPACASLLPAALGERVLVGAQLVPPVLPLVGPVHVLVVHRRREPVAPKLRLAGAAPQRRLEDLLLAGADLRLDGQRPVGEIRELRALLL